MKGNLNPPYEFYKMNTKYKKYLQMDLQTFFLILGKLCFDDNNSTAEHFFISKQ